MTIRYSPTFFRKLKKADVKIKKSVKKRILLFSKNPHDPQLNNHSLKKEYKGHRSINVTADWRALFTEKREGKDSIAYFVDIGTHRELYR